MNDVDTGPLGPRGLWNGDEQRANKSAAQRGNRGTKICTTTFTEHDLISERIAENCIVLSGLKRFVKDERNPRLVFGKGEIQAGFFHPIRWKAKADSSAVGLF